MSGNFLHVAVGVIRNNKNQVLLSLRSSIVDQPGLWEFPGGKLEPGETASEALSRELYEELALTVKSAQPLIRIHHDYREYSVLLDVWQVDSWHSEKLGNNEYYGQEGQKIEWVSIPKLRDKHFPEANRPILKAVQLPNIYLICPEPKSDIDDYIDKFKICLSKGVRLFQLRFKNTSLYDMHKALITELLELCSNTQSRLLINSSPEYAVKIGVHGIHLNSSRLMQLSERPFDDSLLVSASCHDMIELKHACKMDLDFSVLSPVNRTTSHQGTDPLGWDEFKNIIESSNIPVYALGGMRAKDMKRSRKLGGQGISILSGVWNQIDIKESLIDYFKE